MENEKNSGMPCDCGISDLRDAMTLIVDPGMSDTTEFSRQLLRSLQLVQDALNALDYRIAVLESRAGRM